MSYVERYDGDEVYRRFIDLEFGISQSQVSRILSGRRRPC
jgi:hypothetical protein